LYDLFNEEEESKFITPPVDHCLEERRLVALNMPGLVHIMFTDIGDCEEAEREELLDLFITGVLPIYQNLSLDSCEDVRAAASCVLHEIIKSVGSKLGKSHLESIFLKFMSDKSDEVIYNLLIHID
jgi:hypothetical protein